MTKHDLPPPRPSYLVHVTIVPILIPQTQAEAEAFANAVDKAVESAMASAAPFPEKTDDRT